MTPKGALRQPGPISRIIGDAQIRLVNDNQVPVARGVIGELVLRSPMLPLAIGLGQDS
jgi:hypothetical protein